MYYYFPPSFISTYLSLSTISDTSSTKITSLKLSKNYSSDFKYFPSMSLIIGRISFFTLLIPASMISPAWVNSPSITQNKAEFVNKLYETYGDVKELLVD